MAPPVLASCDRSLIQHTHTHMCVYTARTTRPAGKVTAISQASSEALDASANATAEAVGVAINAVCRNGDVTAAASALASAVGGCCARGREEWGGA